jgi:hypothetical protein
MFYIGSHKGSVDDYYICSSKRMLRAYNKRPKDFKRRILKYVLEVDDILFWEQYYLDMMQDKELLYGNGKYYNVKRTAAGGDTTAHLPNRDEIIKRRYGKKHSNAIKRAIKKRSKEREVLHQQRRKTSLRKLYTDPNYYNYQDKPFNVFINGIFYGRYRNKNQFILKHNCDKSNFVQNFNKGAWIIKQKRNHSFAVGDILTFEYIQ